MGPLGAGPILIMADRQHRLMLKDLRSEAIGIDAGKIAHIVPVGFEEADHRIFGVEDGVCRRIATREQRAIVADFVGSLFVRPRI